MINFFKNRKDDKSEKIETIKPVTLTWQYELSITCPICGTTFNLDGTELRKLGIKKLFSDKIKPNSVLTCHFCDLPIMISGINKNITNKGADEMDDEVEDSESELNFDESRINEYTDFDDDEESSYDYTDFDY